MKRKTYVVLVPDLATNLFQGPRWFWTLRCTGATESKTRVIKETPGVNLQTMAICLFKVSTQQKEVNLGILEVNPMSTKKDQ